MDLLKNLDNMITAKDFWDNACKNEKLKSPADIMIDFAKLHVEAALKEASEKITIFYNTVCEDGSIKQSFKTQDEALSLANKLNETSKLYYDYNIHNRCLGKDSILNAYSLENIK